MKKIAQSLPVRLLAGVIIGIAVGLISNESFMNIIVTVKHLLGQVITFCVPLIVIGFIAPSITRLGKSASRMLSVALVLAYTSSVGAALFSMVAGYGLIPHLSIVSTVDGLKELPEVIFALEIPQIMSVICSGWTCSYLDQGRANRRASGGIPENRSGNCYPCYYPNPSNFHCLHLLQSFL